MTVAAAALIVPATPLATQLRLVALYEQAVATVASIALWDKDEPDALGVLTAWAGARRFPLMCRVLNDEHTVYSVELPHKRTIDVYVRSQERAA